MTSWDDGRDLPVGERFAGAKSGDRLEFDVGFRIEPKLYVGPPNGFSKEQWERERVALPSVSYRLIDASWARGCEVELRPSEIVRYYRAVLIAARDHRRAFPTSSFWIRPLVHDGAHRVLMFSWMDTLDEVGRLVDTIRLGRGPLLFDDMDQGWQCEVWREDATLFIREGVPDHDQDRANPKAPVVYRFRREDVLERLDVLHRRMIHLFRMLNDDVGVDFGRLHDRGYVASLNRRS